MRKKVFNYLIIAAFVILAAFPSCNKNKDDDNNKKPKSVKEYNGFLYQNDLGTGTTADWVYAKEKIIIKEFDTYMEVHVGNNSIQSEEFEREAYGIIVTFSNTQWIFYPPQSGQTGRDHSEDEPNFHYDKRSGHTIIELRNIVLSPDIEWCRTKHHKNAYNQIIVIDKKTNESILSIL